MTDRRTAERISLVSLEKNPLPSPYSLINIGTGGFAVECPTGFLPGEEHTFTFALADGRTLDVRAAAAHCMRITRTDAAPTYLAGFRFIDVLDGTPIPALVEQIVEAVFAPSLVS